MGTWSWPQSKEEIDSFEEVMKTEIPYKEASDTLYQHVGDDYLFDELYDAVEKGNGDVDCRAFVANFVKRVTEDQTIDWRESYSSASRSRVVEICDKYIDL